MRNRIKGRRVNRIPSPFVWGSHKGFPGGSAHKEATCNVGGLDSIPGLGISPGEGKSCPLQYSGLENPMDSPWGCKELARLTERLSIDTWSRLDMNSHGH